jgi:hypothetical protein
MVANYRRSAGLRPALLEDAPGSAKTAGKSTPPKSADFRAE